MNKSDSERIAAYLEERGYQASEKRNRADLVVLVTCGVRQSAEDRIYGLVPKIKKENPRAKIVLTGCLANREDVKRRLKNKVDVWLNITDLYNLINLINPCRKNQIPNSKSQIPIPMLRDKIQNPKLQNCDYFKIIPQYQSKFSAFVPIGNGCDNFCAYCVVPYARGRETYRPADEIINEVKNLIKSGYKEIVLIAQNVNSYKSQINTNFRANLHKLNNQSNSVNFTSLLKEINSIPGDFWIRFSTSHPKDMSDELIKIIARCEKVCRHIHLPAQAGDDEVLKKMNRKYNAEFYKKLVGKIKKVLNFQFPISKKMSNSKFNWKSPVSITTDIIVGFPGETKTQFNNTAKLLKDMKFDMAYISQYSPRPGTPAAKLKDNIFKAEKKKREEELMKILRKTSLDNSGLYIGKVVKVLIEGKNKKGEWYGKTETNKAVNIGIMNQELGIRGLEGRFVAVKIKNVRDFGLEGELLASLK